MSGMGAGKYFNMDAQAFNAAVATLVIDALQNRGRIPGHVVDRFIADHGSTAATESLAGKMAARIHVRDLIGTVVGEKVTRTSGRMVCMRYRTSLPADSMDILVTGMGADTFPPELLAQWADLTPEARWAVTFDVDVRARAITAAQVPATAAQVPAQKVLAQKKSTAEDRTK